MARGRRMARPSAGGRFGAAARPRRGGFRAADELLARPRSRSRRAFWDPRRVTSSPPATVGELSPAGDLVAQWVFSLSAVAEDLAITEAAFHARLIYGLTSTKKTSASAHGTPIVTP